MGDDSAVTALREQDMAPAGALLARAFRDNPGMRCVIDFDDADRRQRVLGSVLPGFVGAYLRHGLAWGVRQADKLVAVALVAPPGSHPPSAALQWDLTRAVAFHTSPVTALRFAAADVWLKHHHLRGAHHYLFMLGVEPYEQGRGHGTRLLRKLGAEADAECGACYLETDKLSSVRLYEHNGYVVTREATLEPLRDLRVWLMRRPAREVP